VGHKKEANLFFFATLSKISCLQCFSAVGWVAGRTSSLQKTEWWGTGMVICLERGVNAFHMAQLMPLLPPSSLAPVKSRMVYLSVAGLSRLSWKKAAKRT